MKRAYHNFIYRWLTMAAVAAVFFGCSDATKEFAEPYGPGKERLPIRIDRTVLPVPAQGLPGDEVRINATGLVPFSEELIFRFNGETAEIKTIDEEGISVIVPDFASSGVTSISVGDIVIFGPIFNVNGFLSFDPTFRAPLGANGAVRHYYETPDNKYLFVGSFTNYDGKGTLRPINRIARTFPDGGYDASLNSGSGANGTLYQIVPFQQQYVIAGAFSGYDQRTENISNITTLHVNGAIDTIGIQTFRRPDQEDTTKFFPRFNGGTDGSITQVYPRGNKLLVTGNFRYHLSRQYDKSDFLETRDTVIIDSTEIRQLALLNADGSLDKSFRFDEATNTGLPSANGPITTYQHTEGDLAGKILVFGSFTRFDDQNAGYITRLNADGTIDDTFNPGGTGADFYISSATYNSNTRKYLISGNFMAYNGNPARWIALLNEDGTFDSSFMPKVVSGGAIRFAKQLNDGLIVASGNFRTYGGIARNGFMVLDPSGELAVGYNATGIFRGDLFDVVETRSEDNRRALLLFGSFDRFNNEQKNNIIRLIIE